MLRKVLFFTYFLSVHLEKSPLVGILKLKDNLFHNINEIVHRTLNRLFLAIQLNANFTDSPNIKMLLTMHNDLNNIAEEYCKMHEEIVKLVLVNNKTFRIDINEVLNEIINELHNNRTDNDLRNSTVKHSSMFENITRVNSVESLHFIEKINKLTESDFLNRTKPKITLNNKKQIFAFRRRNKVYNLKVWRPPSFKERIEEETEQTRRMYRGKRTRINQYPFMVSIHLGKQFLCAGSIVSKDLVITAASCLQLIYNNKNLRRNPSSMHVRFASDYTKRSGETVPIIELHFHPLYNSSTLKNNLAIIRMPLQTRFSTKKRKIRRIMYDMDAVRPRGVREVTILGWGATDHVLDLKHSQPLAVAKIDVYNFSKCQDIYSNHYVTDENFCVGFENKGGGACDGDVGGPGVVDNLLLGVISFGSPVCGDPNMPTVFTKLGYYANWIGRFIKNEPSMKPRAKSLRTNAKQEYSKEVMILNQLLNDLILSNISLLDEFLYGDIENDFEEIFNASTTHNPLEHPLVNKSLFLISHIHDFGNYATTEPVVLTTSIPVGSALPHPGFNVDYVDNTEERLKVMEHIYPWLTAEPEEGTIRTTTKTEEPTTIHFTDLFARTRKEDEFFEIFKDEPNSAVEKSETSDVISDNYEIESYEGLSIDVNGKQSRNSENSIIKNYDKGRKVKKINKEWKFNKNDKNMGYSDKTFKNNYKNVLDKSDKTSIVELRKLTDNYLKNKEISSSLDNSYEVETEKQFEVGHLYEYDTDYKKRGETMKY